MSASHRVRMTVVSVAGRCANGHTVGEQHVVGSKTPAGICMGSFGSCLPYLTALRFGASFPWEQEPGQTIIGCPDPVNQVVWHLERV